MCAILEGIVLFITYSGIFNNYDKTCTNECMLQIVEAIQQTQLFLASEFVII